jgi:hypothetical protein
MRFSDKPLRLVTDAGLRADRQQCLERDSVLVTIA